VLRWRYGSSAAALDIRLTTSEELIVASTFAGILDHVEKMLPKQRSISFGQKVVAITAGEWLDKNGGVQLSTSTGSISEFDGVVMTTPLGWLKRNLDAFEPALSSRVVQAINSISVGHLEKVANLRRAFKFANKVGVYQFSKSLLARPSR
jgi:protoporphyrinogen oxidase